MKKMFLIGVLTCFAMPALAQQSLSDIESANFEESQDLRPGGPGGPGRGGPGHGGPGGGMGRGGPGHGGHPGGGIGNGPRRPGFPGGGIGNGPRRPGFPGGGIGNGPRRPGHPGHIGGGNRFPGRGQWGQGAQWWRSRFGGQWYLRFRWYPGYGYTAGACFAQDNDGYLFAGRTASRAQYNCEENSRAGGCDFVGCD